MDRFKLKIVGALSALVALTVVILASVNYVAFRDESITLHKMLLQERNTSVEAKLNARLNGLFQQMSGIKTKRSDIWGNQLSSKATEQLHTLNRTLGSAITQSMLVLSNGAVYSGKSGLRLKMDAKASDLPYYQALFVDKKESYISEPFQSSKQGHDEIAFAIKINSGQVLVVHVLIPQLLSSIADRNDLLIYTAQGKIIYTPYREMLDKNIFKARPLYKQFSSEKRELHYSVLKDGKIVDFIAFWGQLKSTKWGLVSFVNDQEISKEANNQLIVSIIIGIVLMIIASLTVNLLIAKLVLKPVGGSPKIIAEHMKKMAQGNLTDAKVESHKTTGIYHSLLNLSKQLASLIRQSYNISEKVSSAAINLEKVTQETKENADNERHYMEQVTTAITELSSTSQDVSHKANAAEDEVKAAKQGIETGKKTLNENIALSDQINISVTNSATIVEELSQFIDEIGNVTNVINGISEQTNLLALNAAIEAARAGEQGRGFAVVADEVRNLASKTQASTVNIQEIIEKLQAKSNEATHNMQSNVDLIKQSVIKAEQIKSAFENIETAVNSMIELNSLVASATHEQLGVTDDMSKIIEDTFQVVNSNIESINALLHSSTHLTQLAQAQKNELAFFKVS